MYVCLCKGIRKEDLDFHIASGVESIQELGQKCGAGTDCGSCQDKIEILMRSNQKGTNLGTPPESES